MKNLIFILSVIFLLLNSSCSKHKELDDLILEQLNENDLLPFSVNWNVGCDGRTDFNLEVVKKGNQFQAVEVVTDNYSPVYKSDTLKIDSLSFEQIQLCKKFLIEAVGVKDSCNSETTATPFTHIIINKHYLKEIMYCEWDNDYGAFRRKLFKID